MLFYLFIPLLLFGVYQLVSFVVTDFFYWIKMNEA